MLTKILKVAAIFLLCSMGGFICAAIYYGVKTQCPNTAVYVYCGE